MLLSELVGVTRVENLPFPSEHIATVLSRVKPDYLKKLYRLSSWENDIDFLSQIAKRMGKLRKKGEPDVDSIAKIVLHDWQRGRLPYFVPPPPLTEAEKKEVEAKRAAREAEGMAVTQNVKKVRTSMDWLPEDKFNPAGEEDEEDKEGEEGEGEGGEENGEEGEKGKLKKKSKRRNKVEELDESESDIDWEKSDSESEGEEGEMEEEVDYDALYANVVGKEVKSNKRKENVAVADDVTDNDEPEVANDEGEAEEDEQLLKKTKKVVESKGIPVLPGAEPIIVKAMMRKRKRIAQMEKEAEAEERETRKKEPRMKTNKKKVGTHFYDSARAQKKSKKAQRQQQE